MRGERLPDELGEDWGYLAIERAIAGHPLDNGVLLSEDEALMGETGEQLELGVDGEVLYVCNVEGCPIGNHKGGPFLHYREGKTPEDYHRLFDDPLG